VAGAGPLATVIKVPAPITDQVEKRIRRGVGNALDEAARQERRAILIFEIENGPNDYGKTLDLAKYLSGPQLAGATTVAFVPQSLQGHAVLVAMACQQLILPAEAELQSVTKLDESAGADVRSGYALIASRAQNMPLDFVVSLLDPQVELLDAETETAHELVLAENLPELREKKEVLTTRVLKRAGELATYPGDQLRELGLATYLAGDRREVAAALGLPPAALVEDDSMPEGWRPIRIELSGVIDGGTVRHVERLIAEAMSGKGANFVCLEIDSAGGSPVDSLNLANYLADVDRDRVRVVAYVPREARGDAWAVALASEQIVTLPQARLGGAGEGDRSGEEARDLGISVAELARRAGRSPSLAAAMIDPAVQVHAYRRLSDGYVDYFTAEEWGARDDREAWQVGEAIGTPGQALEVDGARGEELGLVRQTVEDFAQFKALYGLEVDPALATPSRIDALVEALVRALTNPLVGTLVLLVGFSALSVELKAPGIGVPGLIAMTCFVSYFWANFLGGTADWLEMLMFFSGLACLVIEFFVLPGFGIFGLAGGVLVIAALILAAQSFVIPANEYELGQLRNHVLSLAVAVGGTMGVLGLLRQFLPKTKMFSHLEVTPPTAEEAARIAQRESFVDYHDLTGRQGVSVTRLVPAGKVQIGEQIVDVLADGELIEAGEPIEVLSAHGSRVVVRRAT
jgi:membrane-bound ClpP family serine protease